MIANAVAHGFQRAFAAARSVSCSCPPLLSLRSAGLSREHQQQFLTALVAQTFTKDQYIVREGEQGDRFYIVTQGEVVITKSTNGTENVITHLYEGHFFGETSLVKEAPRNANVKVKSDTAVVMSIGKEVFNPFLQKEDGFRRFIGERQQGSRVTCSVVLV